MLPFLPLLAQQTPPYELLTKKLSTPEVPALGTTNEVRIRAGNKEEEVRLTYRSSYGPQGGVFEAWRDGKRYFRVLNDGKTLAVLAPQSKHYTRLPVDPKHPLDIGKVRLRPVGKTFRWNLLLGETDMDLSKVTWVAAGDRSDIIDQVPCRKVSYKASGLEFPFLMDVWVRKGTYEVKYLRASMGEFVISFSVTQSKSTLPLGTVALAKANFDGFEVAPLSVLRENANAMWAPLKSAEE